MSESALTYQYSKPRNGRISNFQAPNEPGEFDEVGTPGLSVFGGYIMQAYNAKLMWPSCEPLYSRIWRSDPETAIVRTLFNALTGQQRLTWELPQDDKDDDPSPDDQAMLDFAQSLTDDIPGGWHKWLTECNGRTNFYGFGAWEVPIGLRKEGWTSPDGDWNSKYNDGLVGLRAINFRDYSSFSRWDIDERTGKLSGFVQNDSPNPETAIPIDRLLHITYGDSTNPEGLATMEALWRLERVLYQYQLIHGIGSEHAAGYVKFTVKEQLDEEAKATVRRAARAIMTAQEGNYITEIEEKFTADIIDTPFAAAPAVMDAIRYYSLLKLALYGMQFAGMNTLSDTGSYSALQDSSSMALLIFNAMSEGFVKQASDQLQRRIFMHPINRAAFPGATRLPVLTASKIEKVYSLDELGRFAQAIAAVFPLGENDQIAIRQKSGILPEQLPEEEMEEPTEEAPEMNPADDEITEEMRGELSELAQRTIEQVADDYEEEIAALLIKATNGRMPEQQFIREMNVLVFDNTLEMFRRGAGLSPDDRMSTQQRQAFEAQLSAHVTAVMSLAEDVYSGRYTV